MIKNNKILVYTLFLFGLIVKLYVVFNYSPHTISFLFAPFINYFLLHPTQNPYDYFYSIGQLDVFPYGTLMAVFFFDGFKGFIIYFLRI